MLRRVISKYGLAFHLAVLTALPIALTPLLEPDRIAVVVYWALAFALVWFFAEPSLRRGEYHAQARSRVFAHIVRDPVFYCVASVLAVAFFRMCNGGIALLYDAASSAWSVGSPAVPFFPASVKGFGALPFAVMCAMMVVLMGIRNAMGPSARLAYAMLVSVFTGIGALVIVWMACGGDAEMLRRTSLGFANGPFWGTLFGAFLVLGVCAGIQCEGNKWGWVHFPLVVAVGGNAAGLWFFAPPYVSFPYLAVALLFAVLTLAWVAHGRSFGGLAKAMFFLLLAIAVPVIMTAFAKDSLLQGKLAALDPEIALPESYHEIGKVLSRVAREIWMDNPWSGAGDGSFRLHAPFVVEKAEWSVLADKPMAALNGYWMLLAERGIIGAVAVAVLLGFLLVYWCIRLVGGVQRVHSEIDSDSFVFACSPIVWTAPILLVFFLAEIVVDPVLTLGAAPIVAIVPLAVAAAAFPKKKEEARSNG